MICRFERFHWAGKPVSDGPRKRERLSGWKFSNGGRDSFIAALRDAAVRRKDTHPYGTEKKLREDAASKGDAMTKIPRSLRASG